MALEHQLATQAPEGAVGYRLVLDPQREGDRSSLWPRKRFGQERPFWSLTPVQLPDDSRLQDGRLYRILWVGSDGSAVPPKPGSGLPILHYFLGAPDSRGDVLEDELHTLLAQTAGHPEHAALHARLLHQRAERLDGLLTAERARQANKAVEERKSCFEEIWRKEEEAQQDFAKRQRKQRKREEKKAKRQGVDWSEWLPLCKVFASALTDLGVLYLKIKPAVAKLAQEGKAPPLTLFFVLEFLKALETRFRQMPRAGKEADRSAVRDRAPAAEASAAPSPTHRPPEQTPGEAIRACPRETGPAGPPSPTPDSRRPEPPPAPRAETSWEPPSGAADVLHAAPNGLFVARILTVRNAAVEPPAFSAAIRPMSVVLAAPGASNGAQSPWAGALGCAAPAKPVAEPTPPHPSPTGSFETPPEHASSGLHLEQRAEALPAANLSVAEGAAESPESQRELPLGQFPGGPPGESHKPAGPWAAEPASHVPVSGSDASPAAPAKTAPKQSPISTVGDVVLQLQQELQEHADAFRQMVEVDPAMQSLLQTLRSSQGPRSLQSTPSA